MQSSAVGVRSRSLRDAALLAIPAVCLLWALAPTLADLWQSWGSSDNYSHGYLVLPFAAFLLWLRRDRLDLSAVRTSWLGLIPLGAGLGLRLYGAYYHFEWLERIALVPCVAGLMIAAGGRAAWRWSWPAVLFLVFMVPLPYRAEIAMSGPLQRFATLCSTFIMQTLGLPALAEGNVILLNDSEINIVEACSGLRMLVVFFALSTAVAVLTKRPWLDRSLIVASAVPIALIANITRIAMTGVLHELVGGQAAHAFFHDAGGWMMMPLALCLLGVELKLLSALFIEGPAVPARTQVGSRPRQTPAARPARTRQPFVRRERGQPNLTEAVAAADPAAKR